MQKPIALSAKSASGRWRRLGRPGRAAVRPCVLASSGVAASGKREKKDARPYRWPAEGTPRPARKAPAPAPTMPPMLNIAWKREMVGVPSSFSVATACAFIATSLAPAIAAVEQQRGEQRRGVVRQRNRQQREAESGGGPPCDGAAAAPHHQRAANRDRADRTDGRAQQREARARHRPGAARISPRRCATPTWRPPGRAPGSRPSRPKTRARCSVRCTSSLALMPASLTPIAGCTRRSPRRPRRRA